MTKWMRKYKTWLWGVGGTLLMVTFLLTGPQSIFQPNPMKRVVAVLGSTKITQAQQQQADLELDALKSFVPPIISQMHVTNGTHWMLLSREAEQAGLVGAAKDAADWIPELGQTVAAMEARQEVLRGVPPQFAEQLLRGGYFDAQIKQKTEQYTEPAINALTNSRPIVAARSRLSLDDFDRALAKLHGVVRLEQEYMTAARVSDRRAIADVKRLTDRILVDAVTIPASNPKAMEGIPEPTDEQVSAQFNKFKDVKPGTGEHGFGYLQPPRVKFEWMKLDRDAITASVSVDAVDVYKFWQQNRDKYKGEFEAEKAAAEKDLKSSKVDQIMGDADRYYRTALRNAIRTLQQDGPIKKLPADWDQKRPTMASIATEVTKNLKAGDAAIPAPTVDSRTTDWVRIDSVNVVPGIGSSYFKIGTRQGSLSDLLNQLYELDPKASSGFQVKVPFESPLTDSKGNVYYVNVLEFRGESPPDSLAEVRPQVVQDLKLLAAYEKLTAEQAELQLQAVSDGLDAIAGRFATPAAPGAADQTPKPLPVTKLATVQRERADGMLNHETIRNAVVAAADALGQRFQASPDNIAQRTLSIPVPSTLALAIVQIEGQEPVTVEDLRSISKTAYDNYAQNELVKVTEVPPFSFDALKTRYEYKAVQKEGDNKEGNNASSAEAPIGRQTDLP